MSSKYASGKWAIAICDRCGFRYKLKELRKLTIKQHQVELKVCKNCWEADHPQLKVGLYPVNDPQALHDPRTDTTYASSRNVQWGWNPVGGASSIDSGLTPNDLTCLSQVGSVSITTT